MPSKDLTPIHRRGQKRSRTSTPGHQTPKSHSKEQKTSSSHKRIRPAPSTPISALESLPTELLEIIFRFSFNLNFPLSSPYIGLKLSSEHTFRIIEDFCFRAFHRDTHISHPTTLGASAYGAHVYWIDDGTSLNEEDVNVLRTHVLKRGWMTLERWKRMRQRLLKLEVERLDSRGFDLHYHKRLKFWLPKVSIPGRLLKWPITPEKLDFLDQLIECGCKVDWQSSMVGEDASESLEEAVVGKNYHLVFRLLGPGIEANATLSRMRTVLKTIDWDPAMIKLIHVVLQGQEGRTSNRVDAVTLMHNALGRYPRGSRGREILNLPVHECQEQAQVLWRGRPCITSYRCNSCQANPTELRWCGKWYESDVDKPAITLV